MSYPHKEIGAFYTPPLVVAALLKWAVRNGLERLLDPACGDGRFIAEHPNSFGIEREPEAAMQARSRAPGATVIEGDFFEWASQTDERFDCAAGNPPFIRYQIFKGDTRKRALAYCCQLGAEFSGLSSSWAPYLVATASLLSAGGRMAFVVPAEVGHAPYSAPLLQYLVERFSVVHLVAVKEKLFRDLSEDCWLLYAADLGGLTRTIRFSAIEQFSAPEIPSQFVEISVREWRDHWDRRLRPFLMPKEARDLYRGVSSQGIPGASAILPPLALDM